jgi:hypothetical protein
MQDLNGHDLAALLFLLLKGNKKSNLPFILPKNSILVKRNLICSLKKLSNVIDNLSFSLIPSDDLEKKKWEYESFGWAAFLNSNIVTIASNFSYGTRMTFDEEINYFFEMINKFDHNNHSLLMSHPLTSIFLKDIEIRIDTFDAQEIKIYFEQLILDNKKSLNYSSFNINLSVYLPELFKLDFQDGKYNAISRFIQLRKETILDLYQLHKFGLLTIHDIEPNPVDIGWDGSSFEWNLLVNLNEKAVINGDNCRVDIEKFKYYGVLGIDDQRSLVRLMFNKPFPIKKSSAFSLLSILTSEKRVFNYNELFTLLDLSASEDEISRNRAVMDQKKELTRLLINNLGFSETNLDLHLQNREGGYIFDY